MFDLSKPQVMGVLNCTPDSFSDGGKYLCVNQAIDRAFAMVEEGASIIDIGGESTRPGARPVCINEECARVLPVIESLAREMTIPLSIDTHKPEVMRQAVLAGANMINDIHALQTEGALAVAASFNVPIVLMHMQGSPANMQLAPHYDNVLSEVSSFFSGRILACEEAGIARSRLILDAGIGFGKTIAHNKALLKNISLFKEFGLPLMLGVSRKSFIGALLDAPLGSRLSGSLAIAALAVAAGVNIIRAHDVKETADAVNLTRAILFDEEGVA